MYFQETMSREYLQGLVQMKKQAAHAQYLDELVKHIAQKIGAAASTGATCYLYEMKDLEALQSQMRLDATLAYQNAQFVLTGQALAMNVQHHRTPNANDWKQVHQSLARQVVQHQPLPLPPTLAPLTITAGDIVEALKLKCPGCDVAHQESWVDTAPGTRVLKSGIYISWE